MAGTDPTKDTQQRIEEANRDGLCPRCRRPLGPGRVGSGALRDGVFCSLDCQAAFHEGYFLERARASSPSQN